MRFLTAAIMTVTVAACAPEFKAADYPEPEALLAVSDSLFRLGKCRQAEMGLRPLTSQLPPRDPLAIRARFLLAECLFDRGDYLEASRQFRRIVDGVPGSPIAANALLRAGDAQAALWKRPELDPTYGEAALVTYRELISRYPGTDAARRAQLRLLQLSELFAEKDYKNGVFYLRLRAYDSAILYFKAVVLEHGQTSYAADALIKLVEIYDRLEYEEEQREMCNQLRRFYPDTEHVDEVCPAPVPAQ